MLPHNDIVSGVPACEISLGPNTEQGAVIATNDDAFESKIAAMDAGYFEDQFLLSMKHRQQQLHSAHNLELACSESSERRERQFRREPVINRGTFGRILIKQHIISQVFDEMTRNHGHLQVISLGAGFDTFPFNLLRNDSGAPVFDYLEVDLEPVVRFKSTLADQFFQDDGGGMLAWKVQRRESCAFHAKMCKSGSQYWLRNCDLRKLSDLSSVLKDVAFLQDRPTVVVAELSLVYMAVSESDAVIRWLAKWLSGDRTFVCLEPTGGTDHFGIRMDRNVAARGSPFLGMRTYGDIDAQRKRFEKNGWPTVRAYAMWDEWKRLVSPSRMMELQRVELLDEVEELELLLRHYCIIVAAAQQQQ